MNKHDPVWYRLQVATVALKMSHDLVEDFSLKRILYHMKSGVREICIELNDLSLKLVLRFRIIDKTRLEVMVNA